MLTCDTYLMPTTLKDALQVWADAPEGSRLVAGATDILPWARDGRAGDVHLPCMVDITRVSELQGYEVQGDRVRLNANMVFQQFLEDETLIRLLPNMPYCAAWFADDQIRQQATLVGNIVNASPAGDGLPPVLTLNGEIELARLQDGAVVTRRLPVADFVTGPGRTELDAGEIATAVYVDAMEGYGGSFQKVGMRRSLVISAVCCAALVRTDASGKVFEDIRLSIGGIGPRPIRLHDIEEMLRGQEMTRELVAQASLKPAELVASRSRVEYRRAVTSGFVEAAIEDALVALGAPKPEPEQRETLNA
ncbi:xanthine dehydrogenase family protein subunit M [Notoacmeibacter sp. MSK16QG-6]|uniref:FAD binding domain-containing protein n=1 Tax=Notoacmeibacter sp. MSK16QG-6 TaxID=2957982 RepID=UPI0020A07EE2|nr:FAD binding domain-containing protein [Notoacmeibacter sp. MSK16QG-6]MCP1200446.1 FAD binding domain-containing protein [Notoacmeibacter sp. MSK16QG-6]